MKLQKFDHWWWVLTTTSFKHILISFKLSIYSPMQHIDDIFKGNTSQNEFFSNEKSFVDSKTFSPKLWPLRYWQNTFIRTWNYYYCVINVMLLLYLLAAVRKVENEFTRALLKSWKRTSAHAFCRVPNSAWLMTSPNLWKIPALTAA